MKKQIALMIAIALVTSGCSNSKNTIEQDSDKMFNVLNNSKESPSACVLVIKDGEKIFEKTYGQRDITTGAPATAHTAYRMACITKTMTSMGIMILNERGLLDFDQPVNTILEDFPASASKVTIRHLMTNSSGLQPFYGKYWPSDGPQMTDQDVYDVIKKHSELLFEPGKHIVADSDTNFAILALVIEKISGLKYPDFMKTEIFGPLGMNDSVALVEGVNTVPERAYGTAWEKDRYVSADQSITSAVLGDGGVYSSLTDLYLYDKALNSYKLVSKETMEDAMTTQLVLPVRDLPSDNAYASGWWKMKLEGHREIRMGGDTRGFSTGIERLPDDHVTVIVLTNIHGKKDIRKLEEQLALKAADM